MASKSKKRRRVLGASCILAALIIAGSSFAWFTSKDEVTNRLTATADYGVSIVEDFTPPKDMTPGQTVNKDVSVVNTGSVDAFMRVSLTNAINASRLSGNSLNTAITAGTTYSVTDLGTIVSEVGSVTSGSYTRPTAVEGQTPVYDILTFAELETGAVKDITAPTGKTFVELSPYEKTNADGTKEANEVTTLMAGGQLVVAGSKSVAPEEQIVRSGDDINGGFTVIYKAGSQYYMLDTDGYHKVDKTNDSNGVYNNKTATAEASTPANLEVVALARDYSGTGEYKAADKGLYLFKRSDVSGATTHSGFYYQGGKFYSLYNEQADKNQNKNTATVDGATVTYTDGVVSAISGVKLAVKESDLDNAKGSWSFTFLKEAKGFDSKTADADATAANKSDAKYLKAVYHVTADSTDNSKDIVFYITLNTDWAKNWTYVEKSPTNGLGYFYYRTLLDSGVTTDKLIDAVTLSSDMTSANYLDMTYDMNVKMDSAQVTKDQNDKETAETLSNWATDVKYTLKKDAPATGTGNQPTDSDKITGDGVDGTIDWIVWEAP